MKIRKATEDYLEAMLMLQEAHGFIRSVDVAEQLGVTKPSVSYATKKLREQGYITMEASGRISLTAEGAKIAERIYKRHKTLTDFLVSIGVDEATAREDACRIEHDISEKTFKAIQKHVRERRKV